jgi:hypothetical protein
MRVPRDLRAELAGVAAAARALDDAIAALALPAGADPRAQRATIEGVRGDVTHALAKLEARWRALPDAPPPKEPDGHG